MSVNKRKKVFVVLGTRPEVIKLAPVILAFRKNKRLKPIVCSTGQHRGLLDQALADFNIVPDIDLHLMKKNQSLGGLTARAIEALDRCFSKEKPDLVVVQGDTTTVLCASLCAFYMRIPVAHVEAGLRTGNFSAPFPEEANRVLTSKLAAIHFAPTKEARKNLIRDGVAPSRILVTGNTIIDALMYAIKKVKSNPPEVPGLPPKWQKEWKERPLVLITGHRRENFGIGFESICRAIADLAKAFPAVHFVYPVHLNPNVREPVNRILGSGGKGNIHLIEPVSYLPFVWLMKQSTVILTDSGGIQEEAPSLGKPVLVMRETTERPEAVAAGSCVLVGTDRKKIVDGVAKLLQDLSARARFLKIANPYGDGRAASRIVLACAKFLNT